jgi:hypothetical protein
MTFGWSEFALRNSRKEMGNSYTTLTANQVLAIVRENWDRREPGAGEIGTDRKVLVPVPPLGFFCAPRMPLVPGLPVQAEVFQRQEGEDLSVQTYVSWDDALRFGYQEEPAELVKIVCYSAEALLENGGTRSTKADWEIVTILATNGRYEPMTPLTMARNALEMPGGTKGVYSADEYARAIWFWSQQGVRVKTPEKTLLRKYEVRFRVYQYNTGRGDNGLYDRSEKFDTVDEANQFAEKIKRLASNSGGKHSRDFASQYVDDGFISRYVGIYEIIERKMD